MLNYWFLSRPKRRLDSVPEVLAVFADLALERKWEGARTAHLALENALESSSLKRKGDRRDQSGSGGRTYGAWIESLGLLFTREDTGNYELTLAGEAIINGDSPVNVISNQVLKFQYPSPYSLSRGVMISPRFKVHPFIFLLRLLDDERIEYLTQEEIAKIIVVDAENDSTKCFESVVSKILSFRTYGASVLVDDFFDRYSPSRGSVNPNHPFSHLEDDANTFINWLEYTQLAKRNEEHKLVILEDKREKVRELLSKKWSFIDRPDNTEYFQRKYGLDPKHQKDTRNLSKTSTVTAANVIQMKIIKAYISITLKRPVSKITNEIINEIHLSTGFERSIIEDVLRSKYPHGSIGAFMGDYFEMAFKGTEEAIEFEKATTCIFNDVFGYDAVHLGQTGNKSAPDVLLASKSNGYQAIIDNKAYQKYSISGDHHNRMVHNYIQRLATYSRFFDSSSATLLPLGFYLYISGGFTKQIDKQLVNISQESGANGAGITVSNLISMIEKNENHPYSHEELRRIFGLNRQVLLADI